MSVSTSTLKAAIDCWSCGAHGNDFARVAKKSYQCNYDQHGKPVPTKFHVRDFECKKCGEHVYTVDDNSTIIQVRSDDGEVPPLGFKEFSFAFFVDDQGSLVLSAWLSGSVSLSGVYEDDIRDESILFFSEYFKENGVHLANLMENHWEIRVTDPGKYPDASVLVEHIVSLITKAGGKLLKIDEPIGSIDKETAKQELQKHIDNGTISLSDFQV